MRENDTSFVKLFRQIRERSWYRDGPALRLYLELLMSANILYAIYGDEVVRRGEVLTSYAQLSEATGLSIKTVRNALVRLECAGMIRSRLAVGRHVITVLCYGEGMPPDPSEYLGEEAASDGASAQAEARIPAGRREEDAPAPPVCPEGGKTG